jgi:hypothetical protein
MGERERSPGADPEPDADPAALAARAAGDVDPDRLGAVVDGRRRLVDLLTADEQPHHLLSGTIVDVVRGAGEEARRSRRTAPPDGAVHAVLTDRRLLVAVSYGERVTTETASLSELADATVQAAGADTRLRLRTADGSYDVYPDDRAAAEAAAAYVRERAGASDDAGADAAAGGATDADTGTVADPLERLERLADLHERGALTDAEFEAKKSELLEDI